MADETTCGYGYIFVRLVDAATCVRTFRHNAASSINQFWTLIKLAWSKFCSQKHKLHSCLSTISLFTENLTLIRRSRSLFELRHPSFIIEHWFRPRALSSLRPRVLRPNPSVLFLFLVVVLCFWGKLSLFLVFYMSFWEWVLDPRALKFMHLAPASSSPFLVYKNHGLQKKTKWTIRLCSCLVVTWTMYFSSLPMVGIWAWFLWNCMQMTFVYGLSLWIDIQIRCRIIAEQLHCTLYCIFLPFSYFIAGQK